MGQSFGKELGRLAEVVVNAQLGMFQLFVSLILDTLAFKASRLHIVMSIYIVFIDA